MYGRYQPRLHQSPFPTCREKGDMHIGFPWLRAKGSYQFWLLSVVTTSIFHAGHIDFLFSIPSLFIFIPLIVTYLFLVQVVSLVF